MTDDVLRSLLTAVGPSGYEGPAAAAFREGCGPYATEVVTDHVGSTVARLAGTREGLTTAVIGHVDEIGLIVSHVDDDGFLWFLPVGGWDPVILVGQRVWVVTAAGTVPGVVGRKPIHLMDEDDRKKPPRLKDLHVDIGARDGDEARRTVAIGDVAVIAAEPVDLPNGRLAGRALDNRLGCYVAAEALRLLSAEGGGAAGEFCAVAVAQEETTFQGAHTTSYHLQPDVAIVVDVTHATDAPGISKKENGDHPFGSGPAIVRGTSLNPRVFELLVEAAEAEGIPYTVEATGRYTGTDADAVTLARAGIPTGSIGIPLRYMHSPVEVVDLEDVRNSARLCAAFARRLDPDASFLR